MFISKNGATALSLAAFIIMGFGYGLGLPFVGWLLDLFWDKKIIDGIAFYSSHTYKLAFLTLPICVLIGAILIFFTKETKCRSIYKK